MRCLSISFLILFLSCKEEIIRQQEVAFPSGVYSSFTVDLPEGWKYEKKQGIDSYIGVFVKGEDVISFDFGWYSGSFQASAEDPNYIFEEVVIGGKKGHIVSTKAGGVTLPDNKKYHVMGLYLRADILNSLRMQAFNISDKAAVLKIFRSVKFIEKK